ncbi:MAG: SRPBCC domain-containing protein [Caldilineaceae bacterium]
MAETIPIIGRTTKSKSAFRMEYTVGININASPERIWALLTNAKDFPRWNSTIQSIEGEIAAGQAIKLYVKVAPGRAFKLTVTEFTPTTRMVWSDGNFIFRGVRTYTLMPKPDGFTAFTMSEVFSGAMLPLIAGSLPDFGPEFEKYASDLKREAEKDS